MKIAKAIKGSITFLPIITCFFLVLISIITSDNKEAICYYH